MKCLLCTDDPDAEKSQKDWNKEMDEERLAHHIVKAHYVESLNLALYVAKLQYKIEVYHFSRTIINLALSCLFLVNI